MRIAILTNIPSPYRIYQFNELSKLKDFELLVIYCAVNERNRKWLIQDLEHNHLFLSDNANASGQYSQLSVIKHLYLYKPTIVITAGFTPTMFIAFIYAKLTTSTHVVFTDAWKISVEKLSPIRKLIRKFVIRNSEFFLCVSQKGAQFLINYGAPSQNVYIVPLAIKNELYQKHRSLRKKFDIVFSGRFEEEKLPFFVIDIMKKLKEVVPSISILLLGSGPLLDRMKRELTAFEINNYFPGFIQQDDLPGYYALGRILLFPSLNDTWGIVANEALAAGLPVITSPFTGVADELVIDSLNGFVIDLDMHKWVESILLLLNDSDLYSRFSASAVTSVENFSIERATMSFRDMVLRIGNNVAL